MQTQQKAKVEQLKQQQDVKTALEQTAGGEETAQHLLIGLAGFYNLVPFRVLGLDGTVSVVRTSVRIAMVLTLILGVAKASEVYLIGRIVDPVSRYNLRRIQKLIVALGLIFVAVTMWSANWYTTVVSLGLIRIQSNAGFGVTAQNILGFAPSPVTHANRQA